jgi:hypothetical protein
MESKTDSQEQADEAPLTESKGSYREANDDEYQGEDEAPEEPIVEKKFKPTSTKEFKEDMKEDNKQETTSHSKSDSDSDVEEEEEEEEVSQEDESSGYSIVETSPKGRFKRFNEELGSGAYKSVYRGLDDDTGREIAWNVIKISKLPKIDRKRISEEIHTLKHMKEHPNIIHFISAWINKQKEEVCFITEMVTAGSLRQYLKKIKRPRLKVLKTWAIQVLKGLSYLHELSPPIIHRDIK